MHVLLNVVLSAALISLASWLTGRFPKLAGFIVSLPLSTMLVLPMSLREHQSPEKTMQLARSIFVALPLTLVFFVPFLLAKRMGLGFWACYGSGVALLVLGYLLHRTLAR